MGIVLGRNPVQGGSVVIRVTFRDEAGQDYIPVEDSVKLTLYALHTNKETWGIVNGKNQVVIPSQSVVDIVLQGDDLALFPDSTLKRRVLLDWQYERAGELVVGRDTVDFEVVPIPVVG
jgi:hypothetical protein